VFCDPLFVLGFVLLNLMFSVQCLSSLGCSGVRLTQSYAFCVVFCDPLFVVGFVLLNLMFSV
jgi:hypothetical protein